MLALALSTLVLAADPAARLELTFDGADSATAASIANVSSRGFTPGDVGAERTNRAAGEFDGTTSIVIVRQEPATAAAFAEGSFTWEGFFFSPGENGVTTDGAIADRFISQFRDDKTQSTRITIGLSRSKKGTSQTLCVGLVGGETRHVGKLPVAEDAWHHFALVFEAAPDAKPDPKKPEASTTRGKITWYLDHKKCGEIKIDGKDERSTLERIGRSPLTIGGRNVVQEKGKPDKVDRGFNGLLDELRITARALAPAEFLASKAIAPDRLVAVEVFAPAADDLDAVALARLDARKQRPTETLSQESLGVVGLPSTYSIGGYVEPRRGRQGIRTRRELTLPAGPHRLLVAARADAVLAIDGQPLVVVRGSRGPDVERLQTAALTSDGRPHVWTLSTIVDFGDGSFGSGGEPNVQIADTQPTATPTTAALKKPLGDATAARDAKSPSGDKTGGYRAGEDIKSTLRFDEAVVGIAPAGAEADPAAWRLLGSDAPTSLDRYSWRACRGRTVAHWFGMEQARREEALARRDDFWRRRHEWARGEAVKWSEVPVPDVVPTVYLPPISESEFKAAEKSRFQAKLGDASMRINPIDKFLAEKMKSLGVKPAPQIDDATFLRRVTLDLAGRNPTVDEARAFFDDRSADKRLKLVDRLLSSPEWADAWVGYWQDLLAENPSILKPTLNNSGPFRRWIHDSFEANKPLDQFASELIMMQGDDDQGGTAGFAQSSGNDLPMAMKGHVLAQAFLGVDMKCARCHDAPNAPIEQGDLFGLAAMLGESTLTVPKASTVVVPPGARQPAVSSALKAGDKVAPQWPLEEMIPESAAERGVALTQWVDRPRARLAAIVTSPASTRFSDVLVNRIWQRYFGLGLVEPVDQWTERKESSHPELLAYLSRQFVLDGYDAKKLVRMLVTSSAYAASTDEGPIDASQRTFASQTRRRLSAEQVVDSLFTTVGKQTGAEELNFDPNGTQGFLILPAPQKAWQFASLANERDRPALALPINQMILDVLTTFGWRETRIDPLTRRDAEVNPLQPLMMANSEAVNQAIRLTENSAVTAWCLEDVTLDQTIDRLFLATFSRLPSGGERKLVAGVLEDSYAARRTGRPKPPPVERVVAHVDWDKHLKGESSLELMEAEKQARAGDPPTVRLTEEFRTRVEDVLWSLLNSPEFVFVP